MTLSWQQEEEMRKQDLKASLEEQKTRAYCRRCGSWNSKFDMKCIDAGANEYFICESCVMSSGDYDA